jgi:hypothetical protein
MTGSPATKKKKYSQQKVEIWENDKLIYATHIFAATTNDSPTAYRIIFLQKFA